MYENHQSSDFSGIQAVVDAIVNTEVNYHNYIDNLVRQYKPLISTSKKLSKSPLMDLFSVLELITSFTGQMVTTLSSNRFNCSRFVRPFTNNEHEILFLYSNYCVLLSGANEALAKLSHKDKSFQLIRKTQNELSRGLPLSAQLLKPFQHLFSYEMLLETLSRACHKSSTNPVASNLALEVDGAYRKMKGILERINELKRKTENRAKLKELTAAVRAFGIPKHLLDEQGDLIYEGYVYDINKEATRYLILFDDALLITKKYFNAVLICKNMIPVKRLKASESKIDKVFIIEDNRPKGRTKNYFRTKKSEDRLIWIKQINRAVQFKERLRREVNGQQNRTASFRKAMKTRKANDGRRVASDNVQFSGRAAANNSLTVETEYLNRCCCQDCYNGNAVGHSLQSRCALEERLGLRGILPRTTSLKGSKTHRKSGVYRQIREVHHEMPKLYGSIPTSGNRIQRWINVALGKQIKMIGAKSDMCLPSVLGRTEV
ncbi:hypothetical protein ACOME3_004484 [Neoechinorhynchus agilis]